MKIPNRLRRRLGGAALAGLLVVSPLASVVAGAAQGDCSQPLSNGSVPVATDCLYILNAAVLLQTCTPQCICAPSGELPISATDALACLQKAVGFAITLQCPCSGSSTTSSTRLETTTTAIDTTTTTISGGGLVGKARASEGICRER
jgi:hypothetical protein